MFFPKDWDKPSKENEGLCRLFKYGVYEDQGKLPYRAGNGRKGAASRVSSRG